MPIIVMLIALLYVGHNLKENMHNNRRIKKANGPRSASQCLVTSSTISFGYVDSWFVMLDMIIIADNDGVAPAKACETKLHLPRLI